MLAAGGKLLAVVPNRRGLWARMDTTPFGHGRPYSRSQILHLLRETWFTPMGWDEALYVPPIARNWFLRSAVAWERVGATISGAFCRSAYRGGDASRSIARFPHARKAPAGAGAGTCARALAGRCRGRDLIAHRLFCSTGQSLVGRGVDWLPSVLVCDAARHVRARAAMTAAPAMQRITIRLPLVTVLRMAAAVLRLRSAAGDEGRQAAHIALTVTAALLLRPAGAARRIGLLLLAIVMRLLLAILVMLLLARLKLIVARRIGRLRLAVAITWLALALEFVVVARRKLSSRCSRRLQGDGRAAAGSGGTAPARPRSCGNNARRAGSNSPPRPGRRRPARRARAACISRRHERPSRGFSRPGRSIRRPGSADSELLRGYCCSSRMRLF